MVVGQFSQDVDILVIGASYDVFPVCRDINREHTIPGGVAPLWRAAVFVE